MLVGLYNSLHNEGLRAGSSPLSKLYSLSGKLRSSSPRVNSIAMLRQSEHTAGRCAGDGPVVREHRSCELCCHCRFSSLIETVSKRNAFLSSHFFAAF